MKHIFMLVCFSLALAGCEQQQQAPDSDKQQQAQQERILKEGAAQTGMPAIKNFREKKLLKDILELRDQDGLTTYTYIVAEMTGKLVFIGESIGYGIPAATQYTNPQKIAAHSCGGNQSADSFAILPQADPNGLFSPSTAEGTWVMLKDPNSNKTRPVYIEPRIVVSPFKLK
jgi:hypothetical protein